MKQNKTIKKIIVYLCIISLIFILSPLPKATNAANIINASDTLSDSNRGATADHTIRFTNNIAIPANGYFEVVLQNEFGNITGGTCPVGGAESIPNTETYRCTFATGTSTGQHTLVLADVTNPDPGALTPTSYFVYIKSYNNTGGLLEKVDLKVAVIDEVIVTAKVPATLTFTISNVPTSTAVNGITTTGFGGTSTLAFNTLDTAASSTLGQALRVTTNADDGYIVTVEQDHDLVSNSSSTINSFNNSPDYTGSTTPETWKAPLNLLDQYHTYGHMGLTTDDADLTTYGYSDFQGSKYAGLNNMNTMVIMHHTGPSDGTTQNIGYAKVAYSIEIASLQEAGDYTNTLTYICTPTY